MRTQCFKFAGLVAVLVLCLTAPATAAAEELPRKDGRPLERIAGFATHYMAVEVKKGVRLRALISVPESARAPLPPLLFTQWVSCGSVEFESGDSVLARLARDSGLALVRVDRAGSGDSEGPACGALDYNTEVGHYIAAFTNLLQSDLLDSARVFVFGSSLGSTTAPLVAKSLQDAGVNIAGVAVQGGGGLTHFERMLLFDRYYLERRPDHVSPEAIHEEMNNRAKFHVEYLIKGRHPDEVAGDNPEMAAVREDVRGLASDSHYGRPFQWHQQAAQQNFLADWAALDADVLVVFNEFDQFESLHGHRMIVDTVNRLRPGTATFVLQQGLGHSSWRYADTVSAYGDIAGQSEPAATADVINRWLGKRR